MASRILNTTVDCAHPWDLAHFWSAALGRPVDPDNEPTDDEVGIPLAGGGELLFLAVPEAKTVKNRMHLCLEPEDGRDVEVERLVGLGATVRHDRRTSGGAGWWVLADPEGNEFCVLRSAAERG
ncbi:VOC family protein [Nakamurella flava]|uniref:VOC family protein n=1 Tax=Nakamurella flava TaxID=2576308 RepID=A0A4U6QMH9_9ACTN|nr:VOC family protein [Nakamurella flava]TKV61834.1 VOC family protein [Nakamurella flava]